MGEKKERRKKSGVREWVEIVVEAALLALLLYFVCWPVMIDGASMEDTLASGDRVAVSRLFTLVAAPSRGEIVLCKIYVNGEETEIIKRVIAVPGDTLVLENGEVYINGVLSEEEYIKSVDALDSLTLILSEDEYFVMGDNRTTSYDSRDVGAISRSDIIGKVIFRFYPFSEIGLF